MSLAIGFASDARFARGSPTRRVPRRRNCTSRLPRNRGPRERRQCDSATRGSPSRARARQSGCRRRRNFVVADHPADLFDEVFLDRDVEAKRRRRDSPAVGVALDAISRRWNSSSILGSGTAIPSNALARARRNRTGARVGASAALSVTLVGPRCAPQTSTSSSVARSIARAWPVGSTPRSKRSNTSVCNPYRRARPRLPAA